jgi:hypothetical protein
MYTVENRIILIALIFVSVAVSFFIGDILVGSVKYRGVVKRREKHRGWAILKRLVVGSSFMGVVFLIIRELFY